MTKQNEEKSKKKWATPKITIIEGLDSSMEFLYIGQGGNPSGGNLGENGSGYQNGG